MIRLFAPSTHDPLFRRNAVTASNLFLHLLVATALFIPLQKAAREALLDRLVVYLVPPDEPGSREKGHGDIPWNSPATAAGLLHQAATPTNGSDAIVARGTVPTLDALDLEAADRILPGDNAFTVLEVDSAVVRDPTSAAPEYPQHLLVGGVEGSAFVRFVVDTTGVVDTMTYRVVTATHPDFAVAVRRALPDMKFHAAQQAGHKVRQLVEQTFRFRITRQDSVRAVGGLKPRPPA